MFEAEKKTRDLNEDFRRKIVAELLRTGASAASIARRDNINVNQIYKWKKLYESEVDFVPVSVTKPISYSASPTINKRNNISINITLSNGCSIAFEGDYDLNDITQLAQGLS